MPQVNRANAAVNLNLSGAWNGGLGPAPTSADIAAWGTPNITTGPSQSLGGTVSWQGILLQSAQTTAISIGTTGAMTLGALGIDLSASGANLTIASPVTITLGASQQWSVGSGRTLTISSVITGAARDVTFAGAGTTVFNTAINNGTWTNSKLTIASGAFVQANANRVLGATTNTVEVQSGGALYVVLLNSASVNSFTVAGSGVPGKQAGAIFIAGAGEFGAGKTITLTGASPAIGLNAADTSGTISGNATTGDVTFNMFGTNTATATFRNFSDFTVAPGSRLVLQGVNPVSGATTVADFGLEATDNNGLGNVNNKVSVKSSLRLVTNAATTLNRDYFFEGQVGSGAPSGTTTHSIGTFGGNAVFQGTITATAGNWVAVNNAGTVTQRTLQFGSSLGGKLDGTWNLRSFTSPQTIYLHPNLDISTWTGDLWAYRVSYGVAPTGAVTYDTTAVIDNIGLSTPTLAHSSYTLLGNLTFTGSSDMSLGLGNVATTGGATFTILHGTLTIPGTITGSSQLTKAAIGGLTLNGATSGYSAYAHQAGTLTLNNNNALGSSTATLTITAAAANTLDSTTGATLQNSGQNSLAGNFTWGGSANLTLGSGSTSWNAARTISFLNGKTGILRFSGNIGALGALLTLSVGGSPAGGSRSTLWIAGTNGMLATTSSVTAGYLRVSNSAGLGNATATMWTVSSGAALELDGGISPTSARSVTITGPGPNTDGALRSRSGTNVWSGAIIPPVQSLASPTRIQVDAGTFTLSTTGSPSYATIAPTVSGTPLQFTALGSTAVLNQPRQLNNFVSDVTINNGGVGTVVLSVANQHTGGTTVEGGTCKVTQINATSTGTVQVNATATLESTVQSQFTTLRLGTTGSEARAILKFAA